METISHLGNFDDIAASLAEVNTLGDRIINNEYGAQRDPSPQLIRMLGQLGNTEVILGPVPEEPREPGPALPKPIPEPEPMP